MRASMLFWGARRPGQVLQSPAELAWCPQTDPAERVVQVALTRSFSDYQP